MAKATNRPDEKKKPSEARKPVAESERAQELGAPLTPAQVNAAIAAAAPPPSAPAAPAGPLDVTDATVADVSAGSDFQQQVDVLRGQVGDLNVAGVWTDANPPKWTGPLGLALQGLEAGVSLRNAFANLNHAAASVRDSSATILTKVKAHKTPPFK